MARELHLPDGAPRILGPNGQPYTHRQVEQGQAWPARGLVLPGVMTFAAEVQGGQYSLWHGMYDEAIRFSREDAVDMENDCGLMSMMEERIEGLKALPWHLEVPDEEDPDQIRIKDGLTRLVKGIVRLDEMIEWWGWGTWFGRQGVQTEWAWTHLEDREPEDKDELQTGMPQGQAMPMSRRGQQALRYQIAQAGAQQLPAPQAAPKKPRRTGRIRRGLTVAEAWPVRGDKIGHQQDGTPYILVNPTTADRLPGARTISTTVGGTGLLLLGSYRERFIIHRHLVEDRDYFLGYDQVDALHGVGIRSKIFWSNWLRLEALSKVFDFFSRVGMGLTVWKYPRGNAQALIEVQTAAKEQTDRANVFLPVDPDGGKGAGNDVERHEVPTSGAESVMNLVEYLDKWIQRYIIGQEGSASNTSSSGFSNKGSSDFQESTKEAKIKSDAKRVAVTISGTERAPGLINTMHRYTYPETWGKFQVRWVFDLETKESQERLTAIKTLVDMGVKVRSDDARAAAGVSKPVDGDDLIEPPQQQGMPGMGGPPPPGGPGGAPGDAAPEGEQPSGDFLSGLLGDGETQGTEAPEDGDFLKTLLAARNLVDSVRYRKATLAKTASQGEHARLAATVARLKSQGKHKLAQQVILAFAKKRQST